MNSPNYRDSKYKRWVKRVKEESDNICEICDKEVNPIILHHIVPISKKPFLRCKESNIAFLCEKHHQEFHNKYNINNMTPLECKIKYHDFKDEIRENIGSGDMDEIVAKPRWAEEKKYGKWVWSKRELEYLAKNYGTKSIEELSTQLGRTVSAIRTRVTILGICLNKNNSKPEVIDFEKGYYDLKSRNEELENYVNETNSIKEAFVKFNDLQVVENNKGFVGRLKSVLGKAI